MSVAFTVPGTPVPQGSKVANRHGGGVRDSNATTLRPWRATVTAHAVEARQDAPTLLGPVTLSVTFYFPRPKSHYRANGDVKDTAPTWHTNKPDADKLLRAVCDALTDAGVWRDDSQVAQFQVEKLWAETGSINVWVGERS